MKTIGILGGTFNPIHNGHIAIARAAYEQYHLDEVWFMPNHIPAYKSQKELLDGRIRLHMVDLAISRYPYFKASDYEISRDGNTYTAETMQLLQKDYPDCSFYFIIGQDSLNAFDHWKEPDIILKYAQILVAAREDTSTQTMDAQIRKLHTIFGKDHFYPVSCNRIPCSSSRIRSMISMLYKQHFMQQKEALCEADWKTALKAEAERLYLSVDTLEYILANHFYEE